MQTSEPPGSPQTAQAKRHGAAYNNVFAGSGFKGSEAEKGQVKKSKNLEARQLHHYTASYFLRRSIGMSIQTRERQ